MQHVRKAKSQAVNSDLIMVRREDSRGLLEVSTKERRKLQVKTWHAENSDETMSKPKEKLSNKKSMERRIKIELRKYFFPSGISFARCSWSLDNVSVRIPYTPARQRSAPQNQSGA